MESSGPIIEPTTIGGKYVSKINLMHVWWSRLFEKIDNVKSLSKEQGKESEVSEEMDNIRQDIDNLIIAMSKAIRDMKNEELSSMEEVFETYLYRISLTLRKLASATKHNE